MNKKNKSIGGRMSRLCKLAMMTGAIALSSTAFGQSAPAGYSYGMSVEFNPPSPLTFPSVKGFSTSMMPNDDRAVMSGTMFQVIDQDMSNWYNIPLYFNTTASGIINFPSAKAYYDDGYQDVRSIDVQAAKNEPVAYVTAWARPYNSIYDLVVTTPPYTVSNPASQQDRDHIKVYKIDAEMGNILQEVSIYENIALPGGEYEGHSLHPTSTLLDEVNNRLYICGFYTPDNARCPDCNYSNPLVGPFSPKDAVFTATNKKAFVGYIDISSGLTSSSTVVFNTYDWYTQAGDNDYDMALRMKMSEELTTTQLIVTGASTTTTSIGGLRSGTMLLLLDPTTLNVNYDLGLINIEYGDGYGDHEYGVDVVEVDDVTHKRIFVLSNQYNYFSQLDEEDPDFGYDQMPNAIQVSCVYEYPAFQSFGLTGSRFEISQPGPFWANSFLKCDVPKQTNGDYRFLISGMTSNFMQGHTVHSQSLFITPNNINPFLFDFEMQGLFAAPISPMYSLYENQTGTSEYNVLGHSKSSIYFAPRFADRLGSTDLDPVIFNAPKYMPVYSGGASNRGLGLKVERVLANPHVPGSGHTFKADCINAYVPQTGGIIIEYVGSATPLQTVAAMSITVEERNSVERELYTHIQDNCNNGNNPYEWKPTGVDNIANSNEFKLYPNPATTEVHVGLANSVSQDAKVSVVLMNMYGQSVGTLYSGKATNLNANTTLHLPSVATGIYMVQIIVDGQLAHTEKLAVE